MVNLRNTICLYTVFFVGVACFATEFAVAQNKDNVILPIKFSDSGAYDDDGINGYISVEGKWYEDAKIYDKGSRVLLECFRNKKLCIESIASKEGGGVSIYNTYWEITEWLPNEIHLETNKYLCVDMSLYIDRSTKVVTKIRKTKNPKPINCDLSDDPIMMKMVGYQN